VCPAEGLKCVLRPPLHTPAPQAARWRQEQRSDAFQQRQLIVWELDEEGVQPWGAGESLRGAPLPGATSGVRPQCCGAC
jgi:hypothetical protein